MKNRYQKKIAQLKAENKRLQKEVEKLRKENAELKKAQLPPQNLSTPSSMQAPYEKTVPLKKRKKRRGRKEGHQGTHRAIPDKIDATKKWKVAKICPFCGDTKPKKIIERRTRYTEDIERKKAKVTEQIVDRCRCNACGKIITAPMTDALPNSQIGLTALVLSAWNHYYCGMSLNKIVESFSITNFLKITNGYLIQAWRRLSFILIFYYDVIQTEIQQSIYIHIDETGWRVCGKSYWLWSFSNTHCVFFTINKTRGSTVIKELLGEFFNGVIISDFWIAYSKIEALAKQKCLVHMLRELKKISLRNNSEEWKSFCKKIKRVFADAIRLSLSKKIYDDAKYRSLRARLDIRFDELCGLTVTDKDALRIIKYWLKKYRGEFFTFLDMDVPKDNNHSEQTIRNVVALVRKTSFGSQSVKGADMAAIFLSIFGTLKLNGINPVDFLIASLKQYILNGTLPAIPFKSLSNR